MYKRRSIFVFLLVLLAILPVFSQTGGRALRLGIVGNVDFQGDAIWLAATKKKDRIDKNAVAVLGYHGEGRIAIGGRNIELKLFRDVLPENNFKVGLGGYEIWKGKDITLRLDYVYTWLCKPDDEQCEVYYYKGVLDINYVGRRRKVNITGFGGS